MPSAPRDETRTQEFADKLVSMMNQGALAMMVSLGHRTGLFDAMAGQPPSSSAQIATRANLNERYVREWLGAMVTGGVVELGDDDATYRLPPEHSAWLTRASSPNNLAASAQWIAVLGQVEDDVFQAFHDGQGVPYSSYHRFHEVMAEESEQSVVSALEEHILPLAPGLVDRLEQGIKVLDVGCGSGRAMITMAARFPRSQFTGYDMSEEGVLAANSKAASQNLANVTFRKVDAASFDEPRSYDMITAFDAIHDQARPADVLRNIARALRPDGLFLMQDISGSSHLRQDMQHPFGTFLYTISCMHCMSVSLAAGGPGLGAMWGKDTALTMLDEAGFRHVDVKTLSHDPMNFYYLARTGS